MRSITFGKFCLDPEQHVLFEGKTPVHLGGRALKLLACLVAKDGQIVSKGSLIAAVWGEQPVEDSNLSVQIAAIRRALGNASDGHDWIETVERVGYRFRPLRQDSIAPSVAHLPMVEIVFTAQTNAGKTARAAEELAHTILSSLTQFRSLRARVTSGDQTSADYRFLGSLSDREGGSRALLRLAESGTGATLWAESMSIGSMTDVETSHRIAANIETRVHFAEVERACNDHADSAQAYDLYLRGRAKIRSSRQEENAHGLALYLKALELEPNNPQFLSAAAEALQHRAAVGWPQLSSTDLSLKRQLALRGWENSEFDAVSLSLAGNAMFTAGDPELGLVLTERAAQTNPSSALVLGCAAISHVWIGDLTSARDYYDRALRLDRGDPAQRFAYSGRALLHNLAGEHEAALVSARHGYALSAGYAGNHWQAMIAHVGLGRVDDARNAFARYRSLHPDVTLDSIRAGQSYRDPSRLDPLLDTLRLMGMH